MGKTRSQVNDAAHFYLADITAKVVAESGIPEDRFHLGKILLHCLKDDPDFVFQIDGATGESETCGSSLQRSVQCATSFRKLGLQKGDVIVLMAPNHIHLSVPFTAALFTGVTIAPVDFTLTVKELKNSFIINKPKIVFCQSDKEAEIEQVIRECDLNCLIVTFDTGKDNSNFDDFLKKYGVGVSIEEFRATDINPKEDIAFLMPTSGTTGLSKSAALTHKNLVATNPYMWARFTTFPGPIRMSIVFSPIQWLTAVVHYISAPIYKLIRIQTSKPVTHEHAHMLIDTYRPNFTVVSPTIMNTILKPHNGKMCDLSCFEVIFLGGSAVHTDLINDLKEITPHTEVYEIYGMTELSGISFHVDDSVPNTCGKPLGCVQYRLVNTDTMEDITEPYVPGELWIKGIGLFKGYSNNPKATEEAFSSDGWLRTGDLFTKDKFENYFFIERIKLMLKYRSYQISPAEIENVIRQLPGVSDVAVIGIPDPEFGDLPVACVVRHKDYQITAREIKDKVKETLSDSKQLRGGVIFFEEFPTLPSTKVNRRKLMEMVISMDRE